MTEQIVQGSHIKYSLVHIIPEHTALITDCDKKHHEMVGYIIYNNENYLFYSVEDNYTNPIVNHWTIPIVKNYDNNSCWLLIKEHPCCLYSIITDMYKGNLVCNVYDFDIWRSEEKDCLIGVITDIEID